LEKVKSGLPYYNESEFRSYDGINVNMGQKSLLLYALKGTVCVYCQMEGKFFSLESNDCENYFFNLYGFNKNGIEVPFTCDHFEAKGSGGSPHIDNWKTSCFLCNDKKGDKKINTTICLEESDFKGLDFSQLKKLAMSLGFETLTDMIYHYGYDRGMNISDVGEMIGIPKQKLHILKGLLKVIEW